MNHTAGGYNSAAVPEHNQPLSHPFRQVGVRQSSTLTGCIVEVQHLSVIMRDHAEPILPCSQELTSDS